MEDGGTVTTICTKQQDIEVPRRRDTLQMSCCPWIGQDSFAVHEVNLAPSPTRSPATHEQRRACDINSTEASVLLGTRQGQPALVVGHIDAEKMDDPFQSSDRIPSSNSLYTAPCHARGQRPLSCPGDVLVYVVWVWSILQQLWQGLGAGMTGTRLKKESDQLFLLKKTKYSREHADALLQASRLQASAQVSQARVKGSAKDLKPY